MKVAILALVAIAVPGCGGRQTLKPVEGASLPPAPAGARATPTAEALMTPEDQARPARSDELLRRSEERREDRFDLPPPG